MKTASSTQRPNAGFNTLIVRQSSHFNLRDLLLLVGEIELYCLFSISCSPLSSVFELCKCQLNFVGNYQTFCIDIIPACFDFLVLEYDVCVSTNARIFTWQVAFPWKKIRLLLGYFTIWKLAVFQNHELSLWKLVLAQTSPDLKHNSR